LNYLVPARLGDVARGVALKTTEDAPLGMTLSTVVIERIFDVFTLVLFLGMASMFFYNPAFLFIELGSFAIIALMFCVLSIVYFYDNQIVHLLGHRIPSIRESLHQLKEGLKNISSNPEAMALCFILSPPIWLLEVSSIYFAARSIGFGLSFLFAIIAGVIAFIAEVFPLTPAGLGIHEASITGVLMFISVPTSLGMSIALMDHFARGIVIYIFGLIATVHIAFASRWYFRKNGVI